LALSIVKNGIKSKFFHIILKDISGRRPVFDMFGLMIGAGRFLKDLRSELWE
jgi:hypothetical protein